MKRTLRKTSILVATVLTLTILLAACGNGNTNGTGNEEQVNIKLGHAMSEGTNATKLIAEFAKEVNEKTEGRVNIDVYPNSQLGSETDMLEQIQLGTLDAGAIMIGSMQSIEEKMAIEDLPYMWKDIEHARAAFDGKFGEHLGEIMGGHGMKKVGYIEWGYRQITNNKKPIVVPEDLKGMKIRVAQTKLRVDAFEEVGALPTMLAFSELYGALQQGVVGAQENPLSNIVAANFNEVQKYVSLTDHFYNQAMMVFNDDSWNKISEEDQNTILELMKELSEKVKVANDEDNDEYLKTLEEGGMEVNDNVDKMAFREAMLPVYDKWAPVFGKELMSIYEEASGW